MSSRKLRSNRKASTPPTQGTPPVSIPTPPAIPPSATTATVAPRGILTLPSGLPAPTTTLPSSAYTDAALDQAVAIKHPSGRRKMTYPPPAGPSNPKGKQIITASASSVDAAAASLRGIATAAWAIAASSVAASSVAVDTSPAPTPDTSDPTSKTNVNTKNARSSDKNGSGKNKRTKR